MRYINSLLTFDINLTFDTDPCRADGVDVMFSRVRHQVTQLIVGNFDVSELTARRQRRDVINGHLVTSQHNYTRDD